MNARHFSTLAPTVALTVFLAACTVQHTRGPSSGPPPPAAGPAGAAPGQPGPANAQPGGWFEYRAEKYGFSMMVPVNTRIEERAPWEDWAHLWAQTGAATLHRLVKLGVQLPPEAIENAGVRFTQIPRPQWRGINQGRHSGGRHWYRTAYASNGRDAALAYYGTGPRGSYLLVLKTTVADYERNKPAYHRWYQSVRVW